MLYSIEQQRHTTVPATNVQHVADVLPNPKICRLMTSIERERYLTVDWIFLVTYAQSWWIPSNRIPTCQENPVNSQASMSSS